MAGPGPRLRRPRRLGTVGRARCWDGDLPGFPPKSATGGENAETGPARRAGERPPGGQCLARGEPYYGIVGAENGQSWSERGYFTVVEGKVVSVRESGGTIYGILAADGRRRSRSPS
jgi:hypothetical protein